VRLYCLVACGSGIGAEVGAVAHDPSVAMFDEVAEGVQFELVQLRLDSVWLVEHSVVFEPCDDEDAVRALTDRCGEDFELEQTSLLRSRKQGFLDDREEVFAGAGVQAVLGEVVDGVFGVGDGQFAKQEP